MIIKEIQKSRNVSSVVTTQIKVYSKGEKTFNFVSILNVTMHSIRKKSKLKNIHIYFVYFKTLIIRYETEKSHSGTHLETLKNTFEFLRGLMNFFYP